MGTTHHTGLRVLLYRWGCEKKIGGGEPRK
jgi:hypothetical protein